jgi:beta-phosphoglucomutase
MDMLKAILFDCDGVIADTEPLHFETFRKVLEENKLIITENQYYSDYLAYDDRECFKKAFADNGKLLSPDLLDRLILRKASIFEPILKETLAFFPGVKQLIHSAFEKFPLAIASGARRSEVDLILHAGKLQNYFKVIVTAENVIRSKPHPETFITAYEELKRVFSSFFLPEECLVIEDSIFGIKGAQSAGMRCLAITNSYDREELKQADFIMDSLLDISLQSLEGLFPP